MAVLFLSEENIRQLLTMDMALAAVEEAFRKHADEEAKNVPRARCHVDGAMLHVLAGAVPGWVGYKAYGTSRKGANFHVGLLDGETGELKAFMQADHLGQVRTGAASGLATRIMANLDASEVGLFGSGKQARTQLEAICKVRNIRRIQVYSPNEERRRSFCAEMSAHLQVEVQPVPRPEMAAQDKDIVITATTSREPVLSGDWLSEGTHLNVVGSNYLNKAEVDAITVRRSEVIVVDSMEQAKIEAGDFVQALEDGSMQWADVHELGQILVGRFSGRRHPEDVTLFKSLGIGLEDVAVAGKVYEAAVQSKTGKWLEF